MRQEHPITPPPELRQLWAQQAQRMNPRDPAAWQVHVATQAARWGADQELEAIIDLAGQSDLPEKDRYFDGFTVAGIRANRRHTSLKEQALKELEKVDMLWDTNEFGAETLSALDTIRRALEALDD